MHAKISEIDQNSPFCKFRTFPVTEGYAIWHSIFSPQPRQKSSPTEQNLSTQEGTNFGHAMFLRYLEPEKRQPIQEGTNFGHAMFLRYLEPEKCQNLPRNSTNFSNAMFLRYLEPAKCHNSTKKLTNFVPNCTH